ncbi:Rne/Rng family ribonuclease [Muricoccus radiodurans]|uniref:Rne/Rng family ribonuclease n=1 Tax=Muricoccus radiodurans TaxID=2231721 RepID=UPI003CF3755F
MTKRMLIDASHPEETRVVVLDGNRIEDFDVETENRRPLKGNIYLAKIVRVEPSLQAAFVEYGGNRHGFLAFGEIHPDYYQIPVADRQRLIEMQAQEDDEEDPEDEIETAAERLAPRDDADLNAAAAERPPGEAAPTETAGSATEAAGVPATAAEAADTQPGAAPGESLGEDGAPAAPTGEPPAPAPEPTDAPASDAPPGETGGGEDGAPPPRTQPMSMHVDRVSEGDGEPHENGEHGGDVETVTEAAPPPETIGGGRRREEEDEDSEDEPRERRIPSRYLRHYKIQEVIRRRQIILVQVVKEERGNKGAALTTYISLAGRFSVLMPNSPKGGGVSRKISSVADRKRLREVIDELNLPRGMGIIVRTAGAQRPKPEIRRDCEYLLRLWDNIRERTLASMAPALVYEEANLLKRSIRDNFSRDIEEVQIEGEEAFREAREFMRALMPQHERKVKHYREPGMPLFARAGVEAQLDAMMSPVVQLRSGGYIVINQTEALVSIDVNSGRATRDRHIEDTALRTNLEAADEIARQLRLRDLAGLIVIDFIDMESSRNDAMVERRLKEALTQDRARIQVGRISHFGLLEMSRQRLRPSLTEHAFVTCPHCQGLGIVRSADSAALAVLRAIEEEGARRRAAEIVVHCAAATAMHLLNHKRERIAGLEERHAMCVLFEPDPTMHGAQLRIERTRPQIQGAPVSAPPAAAAPALRMDYVSEPAAEEAEDLAEEEGEEENGPAGAEGGDKSRRRRRRRRGGRREEGRSAEEGTEATAGEELAEAEEPRVTEAGDEEGPGELESAGAGEAGRDSEGEPGEEARNGDPRRRRRRRRRGEAPREGDRPEVRDEERPEMRPEPRPEPRLAPRYTGPTPADPFAGTYDHLLDAMEAAEEAAAAARPRPRAPVTEAPAAALPGGIVSGEAPAEAAQRAEPADAVEPVAEAAAQAPAESGSGFVTPEAAAAAAEAPVSEAPSPEAPIPATPEPAPEAAPAPAPEPVAAAEPPRQEPVAAPPIQPVVLGTPDAPSAPPKRGWWRR